MIIAHWNFACGDFVRDVSLDRQTGRFARHEPVIIRCAWENRQNFFVVLAPSPRMDTETQRKTHTLEDSPRVIIRGVALTLKRVGGPSCVLSRAPSQTKRFHSVELLLRQQHVCARLCDASRHQPAKRKILFRRNMHFTSNYTKIDTFLCRNNFCFLM